VSFLLAVDDLQAVNLDCLRDERAGTEGCFAANAEGKDEVGGLAASLYLGGAEYMSFTRKLR
jgi:hypothetical protein